MTTTKPLPPKRVDLGTTVLFGTSLVFAILTSGVTRRIRNSYNEIIVDGETHTVPNYLITDLTLSLTLTVLFGFISVGSFLLFYKKVDTNAFSLMGMVISFIMILATVFSTIRTYSPTLEAPTIVDWTLLGALGFITGTILGISVQGLTSYLVEIRKKKEK